MSKQSEAKKSQGYRDGIHPMCGECENYTSEITSQNAGHGDYEVEKKKKCELGGFAVKKGSWCRCFEWSKGGTQ